MIDVCGRENSLPPGLLIDLAVIQRPGENGRRGEETAHTIWRAVAEPDFRVSTKQRRPRTNRSDAVRHGMGKHERPVRDFERPHLGLGEAVICGPSFGAKERPDVEIRPASLHICDNAIDGAIQPVTSLHHRLLEKRLLLQVERAAGHAEGVVRHPVPSYAHRLILRRREVGHDAIEIGIIALRSLQRFLAALRSADMIVAQRRPAIVGLNQICHQILGPFHGGVAVIFKSRGVGDEAEARPLMTGIAAIGDVAARKRRRNILASTGKVAGALDHEAVGSAPAMLDSLPVPIAWQIDLKTDRRIAGVGGRNLPLEPAIRADYALLVNERRIGDDRLACGKPECRGRNAMIDKRRAAHGGIADRQHAICGLCQSGRCES